MGVLWLLRWVFGGVVNASRCGKCGGVVCVGRGRLLGMIGVMMRMVYFWRGGEFLRGLAGIGGLGDDAVGFLSEGWVVL